MPHNSSKIALASFPRSGNTWVRYLLECASGELCGSIYQDRIMPRGRNGIVVKTHEMDSANYTHAVHLIRNPFDAIKSYYHWKLDVAQIKDADWDQHVHASAMHWRAHTDHWFDAKCNIYRLRFEDLHLNPGAELEKLMAWLGYQHVPRAKIDDAVGSAKIERMRELNPQFGAVFFRQGQVGKSHDYYSNEQCELILQQMKGRLEILGYTPKT